MKDSHYQHHRVLETAIKSRGREAEESVLGDSPDMTIFSKNNIMCWPKIQNFVSGVLIDFYAFLGVIFGYFISIIAVHYYIHIYHPYCYKRQNGDRATP